MTTLVTNGQLLTPSNTYEDGAVLIQNSQIAAAGEAGTFHTPEGADVLDAQGGLILPGLIDLHLHGAHGYDSGGADLAQVIQALPRHGITAFLPTTYINTHERLMNILHEMADVIESPPLGAQAMGIHMEGPWLSPQQPGIADPALLNPLTIDQVRTFQQAARGTIRMLTFAPEMGNALHAIPALIKEGIIPSMGHTDADYETIQRAVELGLKHATHTYNAMRGLHHREPGALGAVFDHDEIVAEMIADGHHIHPAAMRILLRVKGADRICVVSDAAPPAGLPAGEYEWEGYTLYHDGQTSRLANGGLAGSVKMLNHMLQVLVEKVGVSLSDAVRMMTEVPARVLGVRKGRLSPGYDADLVVLGPDYEPVLTMIKGEVVYSAGW